MTEDHVTGSIRRTVHFSGHVQGVGFRYSTEEIATRFAVTGYVRNLADGRVEVVAEGTTRELDRFQKAIEDGMRRHIERVVVTAARDTGEFEAFRIAL